MSTPMTAAQFLATLKAEGVRAIEHAGWRVHNRAGHGGWGPVNGVMIHHTAGTYPSDGLLVWSGRSDLPGPLAHGYADKGGSVTMTANGRANHAGGGDPAVLTAVINESALPRPRYGEGDQGAADGNAHFYGLEISNLGNGKDPYPVAQYDAAVRWAAGICRFHHWTAKSVIGHKEWSDQKSDPSFDMSVFRADVDRCLSKAPGVWNALFNTAPPKGPAVTLTPADIEALLTTKVDDPDKSDSSQITLRGLLWQIGTDVNAMKKDIAALKDQAKD